MFYHLFDTLTNTRGDSLVGYQVRLLDSVTKALAPIFGDANGTPIFAASGLVNVALTDSSGVYDFYVEAGTYDIQYLSPAGVFIRGILGVPMLAGVPGPTGEPGGNIRSIPSFASVRAKGQGPASGYEVIPAGTTTARTAFHTVSGFGAAEYQQRNTLTDAQIAAFPRTTFRAQDENDNVTRWILASLTAWDYDAFGAVPYTGNPTSANDCSAAFLEMQALNAFLVGFSTGEVPGRTVRLSRGSYAHYSTVSLHAKWEFIGQGGGTAGGPGNSALVAVGNIHGFVVNRHNTDIDQVGPENSQGAADGTAFRQLDIRSYNKTDQTKRLLWARARYVTEDVKLVNTAGNALHSVGNSSADGTLGTNEVAGNVNDFHIIRTVIDNTGGQHAYYNAGIDSNSGNSDGLSVLASGCGGIVDLNFLGNTHKGWSAHGCGDRKLGTVSHLGGRYRLISNVANIGATTTPGTNDRVWYYIGAGAPDATFPAWSNAGTYIFSGGVLCDNPNSRSTFFGAYTEFGEIGICHVAAPSMAYGGSLDTDFTKYSSFEFIPYGVGAFRSHNGGYGSYVSTDTYSQATKDAYGAYLFAAFGEEMLQNGGTFLHVGRHNASLYDLRGKYLGVGAGVAFDWANDSNNPFLEWCGPNYAPLHGRTTKFGLTERYPIKMRHGILLASDGRLVAQTAGVPATGQDYAAGEYRFNAQTTDACSAFYCTVAAGGPSGTATWLKTGTLFLDTSVTYDPPSLAPGTAGPKQTLAITGVVAGDDVRIRYSGDAQGIEFRGWVAPNGTLNYYAHNPSGNPIGTVDLASAALKIRVEKMA